LRIDRDGEMRLVVATDDEEDTRALATRLAAEFAGGEVLALRGNLGAGKTVFVQGLACGLGAREPVTSPSFVIAHQYRGRLLLHHVDLYRLNPEQAADLGLEDLIAPDSVVAIEWAERLPAHLRRRVSLDIALDFGGGERARRIRVAVIAPAAADALRRVAAGLAAGPAAATNGERER